mmetsp:Transcript_37992/g.88765  ORF Transcript_37992/g.88765 Transcript_37992/m.88765 type:complete len:684 (-) Transcript_37992:159-2210(-)
MGAEASQVLVKCSVPCHSKDIAKDSGDPHIRHDVDDGALVIRKELQSPCQSRNFRSNGSSRASEGTAFRRHISPQKVSSSTPTTQFLNDDVDCPFRTFDRNISAGVFSSYTAPEPELASSLTRVAGADSYMSNTGSHAFGSMKDDFTDDWDAVEKSTSSGRIIEQLAAVPAARMGMVIENRGRITDSYELHDHSSLNYSGDDEEESSSFLLATAAATNARRAVKVLDKQSLALHLSAAQTEIQIMKASDHPSIIKLYEIFEDSHHVFIVLEHCAGSFSHHLSSRQQTLSERLATTVLQQVLHAVVYLHGLMVVHRDIRPENLVLTRHHSIEKGRVKLTDFGWATFLPKKNEYLSEEVGDLCRRAPEMLKHQYRESCDIWNCGVLLYDMLFGYMPFSNKEEKVQKSILKGKFKYQAKDWVNLSSGGMEMIQRLLKVDPSERGDAKSILQTNWFAATSKAEQESNTDLPMPSAKVQTCLLRFKGLNMFKKAALMVVAGSLSEEDLDVPTRTFLALDRDGNGRLSGEELAQRLRKWPTDTDGCHMEDFSHTEFLAATFDREKCLTDKTLRVAFDVFDKDRDGHISRDEIVSGNFFGPMSAEKAAQLMDEIDGNGDSLIDFEEFCTMMQQQEAYSSQLLRKTKSQKSLKQKKRNDGDLEAGAKKGKTLKHIRDKVANGMAPALLGKH